MYDKTVHCYSCVIYLSFHVALPMSRDTSTPRCTMHRTATFMLTLNVSCSGLHCTESSPPVDNRSLGTEHDTQLLVHLVQELPVLSDRSSTFPEGCIAADQNKIIWFALMSKASLDIAVRAPETRSNARRWLISLWSGFFPCRTVSSSYPFLLLPPGAYR